MTHVDFMREALRLAEESAERGEVPVGAVVVMEGRIVGRGRNGPIASNDPTAHAEIIALRDAGRTIGNYRFDGAALYVTVEPCLMCVGAMVHARLATVVFGVAEPKSGALESTVRAHELPGLNHRLAVVSGVLAAECEERMRRFFAARREEAR